MCFNASVSLFTFLFGSVGSVILYKFSDLKPEAIFYLWVCLMQLIEYFIWKSQNCEVNYYERNVNLFFSKIGVFVNHFEPIIYWLAIMYLSKYTLHSSVSYLMILFVLLTFYYLKNIMYQSQCTTVTKESYPHLYWYWNQGSYSSLYYLYFLLMLVLLSLNNPIYGNYHSMLIVVSFIISYLIYKDTHTVGAMWCFAASFAPWALWLVYK
jgi:hypothetical protein